MPEPVNIASMGREELTSEVDLQAVRGGFGLNKWVNEKVPGATEVVLTDTTLVYNIPVGKQVLIANAWMMLNTASDACHTNLVSCTVVDGGGVATDIDGHMKVESSSDLYGSEHYKRDYRVLLLVKYSSGARSITFRVDASDASCEIGCGWQGWVEDEN